MDLSDFTLGGDHQVKGLQVTLSPREGLNQEEFDYQLSLDEQKYLGIESD